MQETTPRPPATTPPPRGSRASARALLGAWWLLIFTATHVPIPPPVGEPQIPDKSIHFVMYFVLGALLPLWDGWGSRPGWRRLLGFFGVLAAYALADELLQIPVGRSAEWLDGLADLLGGAAGLTGHALLRRLQRAAPSIPRRPPR